MTRLNTEHKERRIDIDDNAVHLYCSLPAGKRTLSVYAIVTNSSMHLISLRKVAFITEINDYPLGVTRHPNVLFVLFIQTDLNYL